MKSVLLIGLGRFGRRMAGKLRELNHDVLAIDKNEERVNDALEFVTSAQIADATSESFMRSLGVSNFDLCVVAIGDDFQSSLEATALLKDCGARFVLSRASREVHARFLLRNGADDVVYPERQTADWAAMRYSSEHIFDYVKLSPEYSIYEIAVPEEWLNKSVMELAVRQKYRVNVLGVKKGSELQPMPGPSHRFEKGEKVLILGHDRDVQALLRIA